MKKIYFFLYLAITVAGANAQVTSLNENFNLKCASSNFPASWLRFNPVPSTDPDGAWHCDATAGRYGTPGMECSGFYSGTHHLDTAFFITPLLDIHAYSKFYFRFDSKTTKITAGAQLYLMIAPSFDSIFTSASDTDVSVGMAPPIGNPDSSDWVTHEINLTAFIPMSQIYIGFMYVSSATASSTWFLDNINTASNAMFVSDLPVTTGRLMVIGNATHNRVKFSYDFNGPLLNSITLYDMNGRRVYTEEKDLVQGIGSYELDGLDLISGIYLLKVANSTGVATARVCVQ